MASPEHPGGLARPHSDGGLLAADDPSPVAMLNPAGTSPFLLTGDHAGKNIPKSLDRLGISEADLSRHIAWDIGVGEVGALLSAELDAVFIHQRYSRLVIDCNRAPDSAEAIPAVSDGTPIPANQALTARDRAERIEAIHRPYHRAITNEIDRRAAIGQPTILIALHSFTPIMAGVVRPWDIGILHDGGDPAFARATLAALMPQGGFVIGDNEPYHMDSTDHSVPLHAYARRIPYAEVEFRQDHIATLRGAASWASRLGTALRQALSATE